MIAYIKGNLADIMQDRIVIDVSGIGWQVFVPGQVLDHLPAMGNQSKYIPGFRCGKMQ